MDPDRVPRPAAGGLALSAAFFILSSGAASGQTSVWVTHGPVGGSVHCVVADPSNPSRLYAGTDRGVFKTENAGASWSFSGAGMPQAQVQTIAIDPTADGTLYAGTVTPTGVASLGIFKSVDGGATWTAINAGLIDPLFGISPVDIETLAIVPGQPTTILAGSRFSEIFKSSDSGATWQPQTIGGSQLGLEVSAFGFDPTHASTVYAASTLGLLRSTDSGETWTIYGNLSAGLFALVVDPTSPTTLYGGNTDGAGILKSTDGGVNWLAANQGLPVIQNSGGTSSPVVLSLALDPVRPSTLYAGTYGNGLFVSTNSGASWSPADAGMRDAYVTSLQLVSETALYAGTLGGGVYESSDGAATWTLKSGDLDLSLVAAVADDPSSPDTLFAATFDGVQKSNDGGLSWRRLENGFPVAPAAALAIGAGGQLFAGTIGAGLFQSSDGGETWTPSGQGLTETFVSAIAVDPSNLSTLYAGSDHPYDGSSSERVFKSSDGGQHWTQTSLDAGGSSIDVLVVNPSSSSQVLAISRGAASYFQSLDSGGTWTTVSPDSRCGVVDTAAFPPSGSALYLGGSAGICRSTDGGKTWSVTAVANLASIQVLLFDPADASTLYAGASPAVSGGTGGVFKSDDGGQTWTALGEGLSSQSVRSLALDALDRLHAGIYGGGVAELQVPVDRPPVDVRSGSRGTAKVLPPR